MKQNSIIQDRLDVNINPEIDRRVEYEVLLNDALNKALCSKNRIKGIPSSNKIAEFVRDYLNKREI